MVVVAFKIIVGDLVDSEVMQIIPLGVAKSLVEMLLNPDLMENAIPQLTNTKTLLENTNIIPVLDVENDHVEVNSEVESRFPLTGKSPDLDPGQALELGTPRNIELILDIPLQVTVVLGRTRKEIRDVLSLTPGAIVELDKLADEPVEILINGTLIAHGEVVVINESFGVRINNIVSPVERINYLKK